MNLVNIMPFGQIADVTGTNPFALTAVDTDEIRHILASKYPELESTRYAIAVDRVIVKENTALNPGAVVALLPPFSGG